MEETSTNSTQGDGQIKQYNQVGKGKENSISMKETNIHSAGKGRLEKYSQGEKEKEINSVSMNSFINSINMKVTSHSTRGGKVEKYSHDGKENKSSARMKGTSTSSKTRDSQAEKCSRGGKEKENSTTSNNVLKPSLHTNILVHIKFLIDPTINVRTVFREEITIGTMKQRFADALEIEVDGISLKWKDCELDDHTNLGELVENPLFPVEIELSYSNPFKALEIFKLNFPLLDVITVHPQYGMFENITVVIEDQLGQKKWLGGYRSKLNGVEYHHAEAQTIKERCDVANKNHRDTQTATMKTTGIETATSRGTQMWRRDHFISSDQDKILVARPFVKPKPQVENVMAIVIQKMWRTYCLKKLFTACLAFLKRKVAAKRKLIEELALEHAKTERLIMSGGVYPTKRDDFFWLHLSLGIWLKKMFNMEEKKKTDFSRKAQKYLLLLKEINCLSMIEKHKIDQKKEYFNRTGIRFLEKTSCPKVFKNKNGNLITVDDPETQKARELKEIYSDLIRKRTSNKERICFLNSFRILFTHKFSLYEYARDIVSLVDREIFLISIGMKDKALKGLRLRIEQLFINFVQDPEFNPKAAKYERVNLPLTTKQEHMCVRCRRLFPASKFPVHFRMKDYSVCTSCQFMYDIGHIHTDLAPYKRLLNQVRQEEMDRCSSSAICFLLQPPGMAYLTTKIWHDHSAISECNVMSNLSHVRWLRDIEWSPWNTVLLTGEEAQYHSTIEDIRSFYNPDFIMMVHQRHIMARSHFADLEKVNWSLCSSGEWTSNQEADFHFEKRHAADFLSHETFDRFEL